MRKEDNTVVYSIDELRNKLARGEDRPNREKADQITGERLEASILAEPDDVHQEPDWTQAIQGIPPAKTTSTSASTMTFPSGSGQTGRATRP